MRTRTARLLLVATVSMLAAAALLVGCAPAAAPSGPSVQPVPTETVEPTASVEPTLGTSAEAISTPAAGTAARKAILSAVAEGLSASGKMSVYQLYAQGPIAIGDVQPVGGARSFVALTGGPEAFKLVWSAPFGTTRATVAKLIGAVPDISSELAAKLDFSKVVNKPAAAPTLASFQAFVLKSAQTMAAGTYDGTFTVTAKIARDSKGEWWGNGVAEPADTSFDPIGIWGHDVSGKWTGEPADFSSEDADAGYFPADVLSKLRF